MATQKQRLTNANVARLRAASEEYTVWYTRMAGFGVRVRPTGHRTYVFLNPQARTILDRQPRSGSPYVFPSPLDGSRPRSSGDFKLWYIIRKRAGIEDVRLHDLRHTVASHAVMNSIPLPTVARLLGHRDVRMTLRYAHVHDLEVADAAERIGQFITDICAAPDQ